MKYIHKLISFVLGCVLTLSLIPVTTNIKAGEITPTIWDGTTADISWYNSTDTEFTLTTAEQLAGLGEIIHSKADFFADKTIKLGADIWLNDTSDYDSWSVTAPNNKWIPIGDINGNATQKGYFSGTLDGQGHIIYGLYATERGSALFRATNGATLQNLGLMQSYTTTDLNASTLIARAENTTVNNCYTDGTVISTRMQASGLIGSAHNYNNKITNTYTSAFITNVNRSGAFIAANVGIPNKPNIIENSYYQLYDGGVTTPGTGLISYLPSGYVPNKSADEFTNGTVARLLQGTQTEAVWGHTTLDGSEYPQLIQGNSNAHRVLEVTFNWGETDTLTKLVLADFPLEAPVSAPAGYHYEWKSGEDVVDITNPVITDLTLSGTLVANTNTPYTVIRHFQNIEDDNYTPAPVENYTGTTGENIIPDTGSYSGFIAKRGLPSGNILGDGSLVLDIYYDRETYPITLPTDDTYVLTAISSATPKFGSIYQFTLTPAQGFEHSIFTVTIDGTSVTPDAQGVYSIHNMSATPTIEVNVFKQHQVTITQGGTSGIYPVGTAIELQAPVASEGMVFDKWVITGNGTTTYIDALEADFIVPDYAVTITPTFRQITVDPSADENQIAGVSQNQDIIKGNPIEFVAVGAGMDNVTPERGDVRWLPTSWSFSDTDTWADAPYSASIPTTTLPLGTYTLTTQFVKQQFNGTTWETLSQHAEKTATVNLIPNTNTPYKIIRHFQNIEDDDYTAAPAENYTGTTDALVTATADSYPGFILKGDLPSGIIHVDGSLVLDIYYDRETYLVTLPTDEGFILTTISSVTPKFGSTYQFTLTPELGYEHSIFTVTIDGQIITPDAQGIYTVNNISTTPIIEVTVQKQHQITIGEGTEPTIHPVGSIIRLQAPVAPEGMVFDKWVITGNGTTTYIDTPEADFTVPDYDVTITPTYKESPTDPIDPIDPIDPVDPTDPTDPIDPIDPTDPSEPTDPTDPIDPTDPTNPTDPNQPVEPTDPEEAPTQPNTSEQPISNNSDTTKTEATLVQTGTDITTYWLALLASIMLFVGFILIKSKKLIKNR